jgi:hypothetical protein
MIRYSLENPPKPGTLVIASPFVQLTSTIIKLDKTNEYFTKNNIRGKVLSIEEYITKYKMNEYLEEFENLIPIQCSGDVVHLIHPSFLVSKDTDNKPKMQRKRGTYATNLLEWTKNKMKELGLSI